MVIDTPGSITEGITLLGRNESCIYLFGDDGEYNIIGGGLTYIIPDVLGQIEALGIDEQQISRIIILHAHFDHVGIVPFFRQRWPWATVCASEKGRQRLADPRTTDTITRFNALALNNSGIQQAGDLLPAAGSFTVDEVLSDRDVIRCGGLHLEVIEVPGHSSCSIALYCPQKKALFASDAGGIFFQDRVFTAANSNFDLYQRSLLRMATLEAEIYLAEHYGALTGEDARTCLARSIEAARQVRGLLENTLRETGNAETTTHRIVEIFTGAGWGSFVPVDLMHIMVGQMTRYIARTLDRETT